MGKAPAFQFYVKDWLSDPQLQSVCASTKGIWIDALCFMWEAPQRGKLVGTEESLRKLLRANDGDFTKFMEDAKRYEFVTVTKTNNEITLINRRMFREYNDKENNRLRQQRYREKHKDNTEITPPSSSSSSSSSSNTNTFHQKRKKVLDLESPKFEEWWKAYPKRNGVKTGKSECKAFFLREIKETEYLDLLTATNNYSNSKEVKSGYAKDPIRFLKKEIWRDFIFLDISEPSISKEVNHGMTWLSEAIQKGWK